MAEVASAYVSLLPSAKGFGSSIDRQIGPELDSAGKRGGKRFGGVFGSAFKGVLAGIGIATAVQAGVDLLSSSIGEAREAQKVGALTAQVIRSTGGAAQVSAKHVGALSTAISNVVGVDDEAIQKGANLLLTFKNIRNEAGKGNKIFDEATKAAVDLSAAGFGSIDSASKQLGKALNDPIKGVTALGRAGVTFTESQKKQIKAMVQAGDVLGAQKIILKEVNSQVGGAAKSQATAGEKMRVAWANLQEQIGTALLPVIDKLSVVMTTQIIPAISRFISFLQANPGVVKAFAIGVAAIAAAFVVAFVAANAIVIGIGLVVAALVYAYTKSETFRTIVNAVFKFVATWITVQIKIIVAVVKGGIATVLAIWNTIKAIVGFVRSAFSNAKAAVSTAISAIKTAVSNGVSKVIGFFKSLPGKAKDALGNLGSTLKNAGKQLIQGFIDGIKDKFADVKNTLGGLTKKLTSWKGPQSLDKVILRQSGQLVIEGFISGLEDRYPRVESSLSGLTNSLSGAAAFGADAGSSSVSFDVGSSRTLAPAGTGLLTITNWRDGTGYFEQVADGRVADRAELVAMRGRQTHR